MYKPSLTPLQRRACRERISSFWHFTDLREIDLRYLHNHPRQPLRTPTDPLDMLADFEARLTAWRVRMNEQTANARWLLDDVADPPDPATWAATIIAAGQVWLTKGLHLQPAGVSLYGSVRRRVLMQDRSPPPGCGRGWSSVCDFAGNAVGLFADAISRYVAAWMDDHGVSDPCGYNEPIYKSRSGRRVLLGRTGPAPAHHLLHGAIASAAVALWDLRVVRRRLRAGWPAGLALSSLIGLARGKR